MFSDVLLFVQEPRPRWKKRGTPGKANVATVTRRPKVTAPLAASPKKRAARRVRPASDAASLPVGWQRRLREQAHNVARAIEMLEQAMSMMSEPRPSSLARAECLRGAGLLTLLAASEVLVVAGWFEADQAVSGGTLEP